jgi:membrane-bound serine protease (ClpP class)
VTKQIKLFVALSAVIVGVTMLAAPSGASPSGASPSGASPSGASPSGASPSGVSSQVGSSKISAVANFVSTPVGAVRAIQITGLIDDIIARYLDRTIGDAEAAGDQAVILQINSPGDVLSDAKMTALLDRIANAKVPVTAWIGPSGARATKGAAVLVLAADRAGMAPGSRFGDLSSVKDLAAKYGGDIPGALFAGTVGASQAVDLGVMEVTSDQAATFPNFLGNLDGVEVDGVTLVTAQVNENGTRVPLAVPKFVKPTLVEQLMHSVASPPVAYLLLTVGSILLVLEFFTAGVGVAGLTGAGCLILGLFGAAALPLRWWALALVLGAAVALAVDVQTAIPRVWTVFGLIMHLVGAIWLWHDLSSGWIAIAAGTAGMALMAYTALPSLVRSRFSTPTIGREWLIGELGEAVSSISPTGVVRVAGATWSASTNRATPIPAGSPLRVASIDGNTLEVEPLEGAARDHRERRSH